MNRGVIMGRKTMISRQMLEKIKTTRDKVRKFDRIEQQLEMIKKNMKETEKLLQTSDEINQVILNSLTARIALLDNEGDIIAVNETWKTAVQSNDSQFAFGVGAEVGLNYFQLCERAPEQYANTIRHIVSGIRSVLEGAKNGFISEYFCNTAKGKRWFVLRVTPFASGDGGVVISHLDSTSRKQAEEVILQKNAQLTAILDNIPHLAWLKDKQNRYIAVNESFAKSVVLTKEQIIGKTVFDIFPEGKAQEISAKDIEVIVSKKQIAYEQYTIEDDKKYWVETFKAPVFDENDNIIGIAGLEKDITHRKQTREAILQREAQLKAILDNIPYYAWLKDRDGKYLAINRGFAEVCGLSVEQIIGKTVFDIYPKEIAERYWLDDIEVMKSMKHVEVEEIREGKMGSFWVEKYKTPIYAEKGGVIGTTGFLKDITERKRAEKLLRESEERYRKLVELSPDTICVHVEGKIVFANYAALKLFGAASFAEIIGKQVNEMVHHHYHEILEKIMKSVLIEGKIMKPVQQKMVRLDGTIIDVEVSSISINYQGKPAVQAVIRDITERKREVNKAAVIQKQGMEAKFPLVNRANFDFFYLAADTISGDLFHFYHVQDDSVIGFIGDVTGKGVVAALNNSAVKVLFYEAASITTNPLEILNYMNRGVGENLSEDYVAACCFSFDFCGGKVTVASAGINIFDCEIDGHYSQRVIKGPFLGMFKDCMFEQQTFYFHKGDRFYFYTDGLEEVLNNTDVLEKLISLQTLQEQKAYLRRFLLDTGKLKDDSTWLGIEIK